MDKQADTPKRTATPRGGPAAANFLAPPLSWPGVLGFVDHAALGDVLERMSDAFFVLDGAWRMLACNAEHERLTGLPRAQQLGRDFRELFLQGEGAEVARYTEHYRHTLTHRRPLCFVEYYPPLQLWTECRVFPAGSDGIAVFCRNVTELHEGHLQRIEDQHKFAAIFRTAPAAMALLRGEDLVFEQVNARYETLIGGRATVGRKFREVLHELGDGPFERLLCEVLRTGEPYVEREREIRYICRPGGEPEDRVVDFVYTRVEDSKGAPYGVYVYVEDVTERVRARQQLQDSVRARDDFLGFCSHELKSPVAALQLSAQSLQRKLKRNPDDAPSTERLLDLCTQWQRQTQRLTRLIDEMADFSRLSRGALVLQRAPCDLAQVVHEVAERLAPQMSAGGVCLTQKLDADATGPWDGLRLEQLCTNLLTNALKYGDGKPIHVTVTRAPDAVLLAVADQGRGIAPEDQRRVFLPYERASQQHLGGSLGVGLYICRRIAEAHGGTIELTSAPQRGTTFTVTLPLTPTP